MSRPASGSVIERRGKRGTVYALRFRAGGRRRYQTLDSVTTPSQAELELQNVLADVRRGSWRPPETVAPLTASEEPSFHILASEWVERRRHEVDERTVEHWRWALSSHLLPFFADYLPTQITVAQIERYKTEKLRERERLTALLDEWLKADAGKRGLRPPRALGNATVNKTLKVLAQVLDDAVEFGYVAENVARGRRRRLKAERPKRTWLELHEVQAVLSAAGEHRALLATMILSGLRISELCSLRWRDLDLASGRLRVMDAKTEAGERGVDVSPLLLDELKLHKADATYADLDDFVFATRRGTRRNRSNVTRQIVAPTIEAANVELAKAGRRPIEGVTNHSMRRTYCALLYEAGATPAYTMAMMGHTDASLALEIYTKVMDRKRDTGERMDALIKGADWALMGTSDSEAFDASSALKTKTPPERGFSRLRD